jgi:uncharacterized circularly permuted ATP-grasp superfamily protein
MDLKNYTIDGYFDELLTPRLQARASAGRLINYLKKLSFEELQKRRHAAALAIKTMGITFTVYSEGENIDREWPYDIIPRIIPLREWKHVEKGLQQRLTAINHFINDIYNDQKIIKDKIIP